MAVELPRVGWIYTGHRQRAKRRLVTEVIESLVYGWIIKFRVLSNKDGTVGDYQWSLSHYAWRRWVSNLPPEKGS